MDNNWRPYDNGRSIDTEGAENGTIIFDLEHLSGARVTIEKDARSAPYVTVVGVHRLMYRNTRYDIKESDALCFANRTTQKINTLLDHLSINKAKRVDLL